MGVLEISKILPIIFSGLRVVLGSLVPPVSSQGVSEFALLLFYPSVLATGSGAYLQNVLSPGRSQ